MAAKRRFPRAAGTTRQSKRVVQVNAPPRTVGANALTEMFDACRERNERESRRKAEIAARIGGLAAELGARRDASGRWRVVCPHCQYEIAIKDDGNVVVVGNGAEYRSCEGAKNIAKICGRIRRDRS